MTNITKNVGFDYEEYGFETEYLINFVFEKQQANVTISFHEDIHGKPYAYLNSKTDGYHWLYFLLSQVPNASELIDYTFAESEQICKKLFMELDIECVIEDKETMLLYSDKLDDEFVEKVARIIEPRFANRERFFYD